MNSKILIIDDENDICFLISEILQDEKFQTMTTTNSSDAISKFETFKPDLVILDVWLGKNQMDGIELLKKFKSIDDSIPIIIISGHGTVDMAVNAIKNGAYDFIEKPFNSEKLIVLSKRAIENALLIKENIILKKIAAPDAPIIGKSNFINDLKKNLNKIANSASRILITGPLGSGKKLVAQTIHKISKRKDSLANILDFSTLNEEDLKEIFDSNINNNIFYKSNNGTLILENIEKIPLHYQKLLLQYLENTKDFNQLDIKIISISSNNIIENVNNGNLRKDLFYRLNVISIDIPPLKKRREDISLLCNHYLKLFNKNEKFYFSKLALNELESYNWPGNIRQLVNYIEKTVILNKSMKSTEQYEINNLPKDMGDIFNENTDNKSIKMGIKEAREEFEKKYFLSQIERFNGNMKLISDFTGMERTALYRKLKSLKINLENK